MIKGLTKIGAGLLTGAVLTGGILSAHEFTSKKEDIEGTRVKIESSIDKITEKIKNMHGASESDKQELQAEIDRIQGELDNKTDEINKLDSEKTKLESELNKANGSIDTAISDQNTIDTNLKNTLNKINNIESKLPNIPPTTEEEQQQQQQQEKQQITVRDINSEEDYNKYKNYVDSQGKTLAFRVGMSPSNKIGGQGYKAFLQCKDDFISLGYTFNKPN